MTGLLIITWVTLGAWVYRDAEARHAEPEHYPVAIMWSPLVWALQAMFVPGFGVLNYLQARRGAPGEPAALPTRWQVLIAPAGLMALLLCGFLVGALTAIPSSKALNVSDRSHKGAATYRLWQGKRRLTGSVDHMAYTVLGSEQQAVIRHTTGETRAAGAFVIVRLGIRNEGREAELVSPNRFTLIDAQGRRYTSSFAGETALLFQTGRSLTLEARQPGLESEGALVFDIPKATGKLSLEITALDGVEPASVLPLS